MKTCPKCGRMYSNTVTMCPNCKVSLDGTSTSSQQQPPIRSSSQMPHQENQQTIQQVYQPPKVNQQATASNGGFLSECVNAYISAWKRAFDYNGRTSRRSYWQMVLVNFVVSFIVGIIAGFTGLSDFVTLYAWIIIIPSLPLGVRRMHDIDRRWYYMLIPFYNIYLCCIKGDACANQFGQPPID